MPHFQPRPLVVIRNQLLAFLVLHLLGSCVPIHHLQPSGTVVVSANSHTLPAAASCLGISAAAYPTPTYPLN